MDCEHDEKLWTGIIPGLEQQAQPGSTQLLGSLHAINTAD